MIINKNALVRYLTIDRCLQQTNKKWTLQDLMDECSRELALYVVNAKPVGKRTIQLDIQFMRDKEKGYAAPIVVHAKRYYTYSESSFSIRNQPIIDQDRELIKYAAEFIGMYKSFSQFDEAMFPNLQGLLKESSTSEENHSPNNSIKIDNRKSASIALKLLQHKFTSIDTVFSSDQQAQFIKLAKRSSSSILAANSEVANLFCDNSLMNTIEKVIQDPVCIGGYLIHPKKNGPSYRKWTSCYVGCGSLNDEYDFENMIGIQFHISEHSDSLETIFKTENKSHDSSIKKFGSGQIVFFRPTLLC